MKQKNTYARKRWIVGICFLIPATILCVMFIIVPICNVVKLSFVEWNGISKDMKFVGLNNYINLPKTEGFWEMAKATIIYAIGVTIATMLSSFLVALAINKRKGPCINRPLMRCLWIFPALLSGAVVGILWRIMFNYQNGLINTVLEFMGLEKINWLETYGVTMGAVIVASVWCQIGLCAIIFLAGLQGISEDLMEAAEIDGANSIQKLFKITIPLMAPSLTINTITTTVNAFKAYELPLNVSNGLPGYSTRLLTQRVYFFSFTSARYGTAAALSVLLIIVIVIISMLQLFMMKKRERMMD